MMTSASPSSPSATNGAPGPSSPWLAARVAQIDAELEHHPGFQHTLWEKIAAGIFTLAQIQTFAKAYYHHVRVFRLYLAGAITVVPDEEELQTALVAILGDEYGILGGAEEGNSHPALFRAFCASLGLERADLESESTNPILPEILEYRRTHFRMFGSGAAAAWSPSGQQQELGVEMLGAVIFGMERSTPHRHAKMVEGLSKFAAREGIVVDMRFFSEHVAVDEGHNWALINAVAHWFEDEGKRAGLVAGARRSFDARQHFLDGVQRAMGW